MAKKYLLGVDVGTTGTKCILSDESGNILGHAYRGYALRSPQTNHSEQDGEDWWRAVCETVREVCAESEIARNVAGIALSTQGGTLLPVDGDFQPLCPAIVWNDVRCAEEEARFEAAFGRDRLYQVSGWHLSAGLPALEALHMANTRPEIFRRTAMFLTVPDFLATRMTGRAAIDPSNAGINQWLDIRKGVYDGEILDFIGVTKAQLPDVVPSGRAIGHLTEGAAKALGLTPNAVLVSGAHDQYAVALGAGIVDAGDAVIGTGTAWVVTALSDEPDFDSGLSQSVSAVPGKWGSMVAMSDGGVCLDWFRKSVSGLADQPLDYAQINRLASEKDIQPDLLFMPSFSGGSYPLEDHISKASLIGLDLSHDRGDIARAIMEGICFQTTWALQKLATRRGVRRIKMAGGATKSPVWVQMQADIAALPIRVSAVPDLACAGAAIMAGVGSGVFRDEIQGAERICKRETVVTPNPSRAEIYAEKFARYREIASAMARVYRDAAR